MDLIDNSVPARVAKTGRQTYNLIAGQMMELEMAGDKELEETVPSGKLWAITVDIDIIETNA